MVALAFGLWAFSGRQDYKNNSDKKAAAAVAAAEAVQANKLQAQFDEQSKQPYRTFSGPTTFGSVNFKYPKTWSAYVDQTSDSEPVNGYFHPNIVPGVQSDTAFALRVELLDSDYANVLNQMQSNLQDGSLKASAYIPPKMKGVSGAQVGTRLDGVVAETSDGTPQRGAMVILKVRDKTLQIYTLSPNYLKDFNNTVLPSITYKP